MDGKAASNSSWGWRSILWGKKLLREGLKWRVDSGTKIDIFKVEWIPKLRNPYAGRDMSQHFSSFKVADLFDQSSREWRAPLISMFCPREVAQKILEVYVPVSTIEDEVTWEHTKNGIFSVKSAYLFQFSRTHGQAFEEAKSLFGPWGKVWGAKIPVFYLEGFA